MMKHEFESRIGTEITAEQWEMVEFVYMSTDFDKDDVANIWKAEGPARIEAMAFRIRCAVAEEKAAELAGKVEKLREAEAKTKERLDREFDECHAIACRNTRELKEAEAENAKLREMVAKLEAELREACVQLFRAQKGVQ